MSLTPPPAGEERYVKAMVGFITAARADELGRAFDIVADVDDYESMCLLFAAMVHTLLDAMERAGFPVDKVMQEIGLSAHLQG